MNGETDYDYTQFYFEMPSDKLDVALYIEADRMQHAALRAADWAIERNAVLNEIDGDASSPFFNLLSRVRAAAFPGQPAGRTPLGERDDVARATVADIARYYHEWYAPNNATLVIAGDVEPRDGLRQSRALLRRDPVEEAARRAASTDPVAASPTTVEAEFPFPFEVVDLAYAIPGDTEHGEPAISTLATLIENQRSPFYRALVESNIALGIEANADTQLHGGLLHVFIILNPGHNAGEAQAVFQATIDSILQNGFDPDLVLAAKRMTIAERLYCADSIDGLGDLAGYTYGIVRRARRRRGRAARCADRRRSRRCNAYLHASADGRRPSEPEREPATRQLAEEQRGSKRRFLQARSQRPDRRADLDRKSGRDADDRAQHARAGRVHALQRLARHRATQEPIGRPSCSTAASRRRRHSHPPAKKASSGWPLRRPITAARTIRSRNAARRPTRWAPS